MDLLSPLSLNSNLIQFTRKGRFVSVHLIYLTTGTADALARPSLDNQQNEAKHIVNIHHSNRIQKMSVEDELHLYETRGRSVRAVKGEASKARERIQFMINGLYAFIH